MKYLTENEIHVFGIQRTGQHAITSWIIGHFDKVCYVNNLSAANQPKRRLRGIHKPYWYFETKKKDDWEVSKVEPIRLNQDAIILGTEWIKPGLGLNNELSDQKELRTLELGANCFSKNQHYVSVIRTPYNNYASILKWNKCRPLKNKDRFLKTWKCFAREHIGNTDSFPHPKIFVRYDEWFSSKKYRKNISKQLGLEFTDKRLNVVMKIGGKNRYGSSFDNMAKQNQAQKMDVGNRWQEYADDPSFQYIMRDEELRDLSVEIFGNFPEGL